MKFLDIFCKSKHQFNRFIGSRGWFEPWPRTSWQGAKEPELAILKYEIILSFQSIWLILGKYDHLWFWVTGIWAPTFLVKVVTHKLYFSGVTAFSSLSADLRSRLKPPSGRNEAMSMAIDFPTNNNNDKNFQQISIHIKMPTSISFKSILYIYWVFSNKYDRSFDDLPI